MDAVVELVASRHKALAFRQFVSHLSILRSELDREGIGYRCLEGSTPAHKWKQEIDAFQVGEGDLFVISLRTGGQGLNLNAADCVTHMGPWGTRRLRTRPRTALTASARQGLSPPVDS